MGMAKHNTDTWGVVACDFPGRGAFWHGRHGAFEELGDPGPAYVNAYAGVPLPCKGLAAALRALGFGARLAAAASLLGAPHAGDGRRFAPVGPRQSHTSR